jgi:enediyne biosynthesis protein E4
VRNLWLHPIQHLRHAGPWLATITVALAACGPQTPDSSARPTAYFEDATLETGLTFMHHGGVSGDLLMPETLGSGCALFDYDGDGDSDLYLVQSGSMALRSGALSVTGETDTLLRNDSAPFGAGVSLRWVDVTAASRIVASGYGMGVAVGDVDGDGRSDLYLTNFGTDQLWRNGGDGTFSDATAASGLGDDGWGLAAAFFDADADADQDLFVSRYLDFDADDHRVCVGPDGAPDYCKPASFGAAADRYFENLGDGRFRDRSAALGLDRARAPGMGLAVHDWAGSGVADVFVANDGVANHLWVDLAAGSGEAAVEAGVAVNGEGAREASMGVVLADLDADRDLDLFLTHLSGETNTLYTSEARGFFLDSTERVGLGAPSRSRTAFGARAVDVDADGRVDLVVANGAITLAHPFRGRGARGPLAQPDQLFLARGEGFVERPLTADQDDPGHWEAGRGLCTADVDSDLATDVVVTANGGPARLLMGRNAGGHRLALRLERRADAASVGEIWEVRTTSAARAYPLTRTGSYASSSSPDIQVGLGSEVAATVCRGGAGRRVCWRGLTAGRAFTFGPS